MVSSSHEAHHRIFQKNPGLFASAFRTLGIPFPEPVAVSLIHRGGSGELPGS